MKFPNLKGFIKIIKIPPAKLESEPCKDKPIAKPAAPNIATKEVVGIPNFEITVIKTRMRKDQKIKFPIKVESVISTSRRIIIFFAVLVMMLVNQRPIKRIPNEMAKLGKYSRNILFNEVINNSIGVGSMFVIFGKDN